jgi:hypothetical protein
MDVKIQAFAGTVEPSKADFRKSTGAFVGAPIDNHRTILEFRVSDMDLSELGLTADDLLKACETVNKALNAGINKSKQEVLGIKEAGVAIRVYDND